MKLKRVRQDYGDGVRSLNLILGDGFKWEEIKYKLIR